MSSPRPVFYVSDGTGITAETIGHSLLTQFRDTPFAPERIPFVDSVERAREIAGRIREAGEAQGGYFASKEDAVLGLRAPAISWGVLLQQAQNVQTVALSPWLLLPAVPVIFVILAFNFLGDGLRDAADPYS